MDVEVLKKGKATIERCITELFQKADLTPAETKAALDGMMLRDVLCQEIEDCETGGREYSERSYGRSGGYSGYRAIPRRYTMTAYGMDEGSYYPGQPRDGRGRYSNAQDDSSYEGGRSNRGGSYRGSYEGGSGGYSRHSIGDRAVQTLEQLMDTTQSGYEQEELHKFIRMIRQNAD